MPEYRRFISYIYEYQSGRKGKNCGYVKVEIRNGVCRLRLHMQNQGRMADALDVHAFVRVREELRGILLGSAAPVNGMLDFQVSTPASSVSGTEYSMDDVRGIWLRGGQRENYITVWDDEPVAVERFMRFETVAGTQADAEQEQNTGDAEGSAQSAGTAEEAVIAAGTSADAEQAQNAGDAAGSAQSAGTAKEAVTAAETPADAEQEPAMGSLWSRWDNFLRHYPQIHPFADDEIVQCIAIAPKDISYLQRVEWQFIRNTFVRQAYARYHHLMLGCHGSGRFVLAVPGIDDSQERHMARMHGFLYYKEADADLALREELRAAGEEHRVRPQGYWYRFLNEKWPR